MEDRIKELEKEITILVKKIEKSNNKFAKAREKHDEEIRNIQIELQPLNKEYNNLIVEHWIEKGKQGLNKGLYNSRLDKWDELPDAIRGEYYRVRDKITHGCSGDWYDGCRGCTHNCEAEAEKKFKEMFGF